ncbi:MAG: hypothetical protein R3246_10265, partial [Acidimicrobiia bacterium]|nr:hypothetical protein [Acidimicrobiia bacterium]
MPITWTGVLAIENDNDEPSTGDGRSIALNALRWDTPIPLRWAAEDFGRHDGAQVVGTIEEISREDGGVIRGRGTFDEGSPVGLEAARQAAKGLTTGLSIDPDDFTIKVAIKREPEPEEDGSVTVSASDKLETLLDARIRSVTMVAIPALVEAKIESVEGFADGSEEEMADETDDDESMAVVKVTKEQIDAIFDDTSGAVNMTALNATALDFAAIKPHSTGVQPPDTPWDASTMEKRTKTDQERSYYQRIFAFQNPDTDGSAKFHYRFPHHHVSEGGNPGEANVRACRAIIGILNGARGGTTIPDDDKTAVYNHLARHMEAANVDPPAPKWDADLGDHAFSYAPDTPLERIAMQEALNEVFGPEPSFCGSCNLNASASYAPNPLPAAHFVKPTFDSLTPLSITDDGRIFGHIADWNTCLVGLPRCTLAPKTRTDYAVFHVGNQPLDDGSLIATGALTVGGAHADIRADWQQATAHYADVSTVIADVIVWEDDHGIAMTGHLRDNLPDETLRQIWGAAPSGDWRGVGGNPELINVHLVNSPGFPITRVDK